MLALTRSPAIVGPSRSFGGAAARDLQTLPAAYDAPRTPPSHVLPPVVGEPARAFAGATSTPRLGDPSRDVEAWPVGYGAAAAAWDHVDEEEETVRSFLREWVASGRDPYLGYQYLEQRAACTALLQPTQPR